MVSLGNHPCLFFIHIELFIGFDAHYVDLLGIITIHEYKIGKIFYNAANDFTIGGGAQQDQRELWQTSL